LLFHYEHFIFINNYRVEATLDQKQPLAKISGGKLDKNIKEPLPTEPRAIVESKQHIN